MKIMMSLNIHQVRIDFNNIIRPESTARSSGTKDLETKVKPEGASNAVLYMAASPFMG
ncbi:MAG: hypothetical protein GY737_22290 [Desulfobacteraceae bacterium]|nr:hypothetical protein [Desulfobacteraceae bacterium]